MNQRITPVRWWLIAVALALSICAANLYQITVSKFSDDYWRNDGSSSSIDSSIIHSISHHQPSTYYSYEEPYVNRWKRRFSSRGGHIFFKHMRKAGGTLLRNYLHAFLDHHGHGTFQQFLQNNNQKEVMRHYPFLDDEQQQFAEKYFNQTNKSNRSSHRHSMVMPKNKVFYIEQEFSTMDWQCRDIDPRWNESLSVIILRHPIERYLSEFFYSGPPSTCEFDGIKYSPRNKYNRRLKIDRTKLYSNETYTDMLSRFLQENLQAWMKKSTNIPFYFKWFFRPRYIDNYQVRALSGCASGECMVTRNVSNAQLRTLHRGYPINDATKPIDSVCTMHPFYKPELSDICMSKTDRRICPECDGPCFHPAAAWGDITRDDLSRAMHSLEGFDMIFITETMDDEDQLLLLADAMGAPRNISIASELGNVNTAKQSGREKLHYYRDLMSNLTEPHLIDSLFEENKLEIELYDYAVSLNKLMTERWKREVRWSDNEDNR